MKLTHQLLQPIEFVLAYLTDMSKYQSIHPLIAKINSLPDGSYRIHERFLSSPLIFTYPATVKFNDQDKSVNMQATIMKLINVKLNFKLYESQHGTTVSEDILIHAPFPIRNLMEPIFKKAHTQLFKNLDALQK